MAEYSYGDIRVALGRRKDDDDHDPDVDVFLHVACGRRFGGVVLTVAVIVCAERSIPRETRANRDKIPPKKPIPRHANI